MVRRKGSGTVVKIAGQYYARWTVDGKRVYGEPHEEYDGADTERLEKKPEGTQKPLGASEVPTLQEWAHTCQKGRYGQSKADSTYDLNETLRLRYIEGSALGKKRLHRITADDIERHLSEVRVTRTKKENGKIKRWPDTPSPSYVRRIAALLSKLFTLACKGKYIKVSPMIGVELPALPERVNRILSPAEAMLLLDPRTRIEAIMLVAMHMGMERGAILRLQWSHLSENGVMVPGTKNKYRKAFIPWTPEAQAAIQSQPKRSVFVFSTVSGEPLHPRNVTRDFNRHKIALGIPKETRLHDLRGTFISLLVEGGEDMRVVMELARHNDAKTTLSAYARSRDEVKIGAVERLRKRITKPVDACETKQA